MSIRHAIEGGIGRVTIDRPERMNALTLEMRETLLQVLQAFARDPAVRCVVLEGNERAFCAGSDVGTFGGFTITGGRRRMKHAQEILRAIAHMEKPVIAVVGGAAVGVGWSLVLACDYILVSPSARFGQVFRKLGLAPDGGAVFLLSQYVGVLRAKELALTGRMLSGLEAMDLGLATELVPDADLRERANALAADFAAGPTAAFGATKRLFIGAAGSDLDRFLELESHVQNQLVHTRDHEEGVAAFREKRDARFGGE